MSIQRDLHNNLDFGFGVLPSALTDNTPQVSSIFNMKNYCSLEWVITIGTLSDADATFTVLVEHGDTFNLADAVAVPDKDLLGTEAEASFKFDDDDDTKKIGYIGTKRFVRLTVTPASNSGAAKFAVTWAAVPLARGTLY